MKRSGKNGRGAAPQAVGSGRVLRRSFQVLLWGGTLASLGFGLAKLEPCVAQEDEETACHLILADMPAWLTTQEGVQADIEAQAQLSEFAKIRSPTLCAWVQQNLAHCPWIAEVQRVAKRRDGSVIVTATYRDPLTWVIVRDTAYLVDRDGRRLADRSASDLKPGDWITVTGVKAPLPSLGDVWPGDDVKAGLKLAGWLQSWLPKRPDTKQLMSSLPAVDVANYDRHIGGLRLRTVYSDSFVAWGLPPGEEYNIENTAEGKLKFLATIYAQEGQLPDAKVIDVRDPEAWVIRDRR
jgi:hypothetical protein